MKKTATLLTALLSVAGLSAFGQGYFAFGSGASEIWNQYTTPGLGVRDNKGVDVALIWAASGTADTLPTVNGTGGPNNGISGNNGGSQVNIVATNGVSGGVSTAQLTAMLSGGWNIAMSGGAEVTNVDGATGNISANGFSGVPLTGSTSGATIEMVLIAWNASAGFGALTSSGLSGATDFGYSGLVTYLLGTAASDPNGTANQTTQDNSNANVLANQFGVSAIAPVPEPGTLALAGLGGLSVLLFRRRK